MPNIGFPELIVVFLVILLLFGANRLPDIGRSLGKSIREFKKSLQGADPDEKNGDSAKKD